MLIYVICIKNCEGTSCNFGNKVSVMACKTFSSVFFPCCLLTFDITAVTSITTNVGVVPANIYDVLVLVHMLTYVYVDIAAIQMCATAHSLLLCFLL